MMLLRIILPCFAILSIVAGCSKSDSPSNPDLVSIADLMPRDNEISGWSKKAGGDASWLATNPTELNQKINGGSELYINKGFVEAAMQTYSGSVNSQSNITCEIQIYDQSSADLANQVFDDPNNIYANPITPSNPPSAKSQIRKDLFSYTMKYTKQRYYVLITIYSADDKAQEVLEVFANNVAGKIH